MTKLPLLITVLASLTLLACSDTIETEATNPYDLTVDYAVAPMDLSTPQATAYSMMTAMYRGDADMIDEIFIDGATLRRVNKDGSLLPDALPRWREWVSTLDVGQAHEEIFTLKVEQFGRLATVWAPFVISVNGEVAGCGVNQLTMAQQDGPEGSQWQVVFGIDTPAPDGNCETFKETYSAGK